MLKVINENNIDEEHICCAMSEKKNEKTLSLKKQWMKEQFKNGLVFRKLDQRGKVFIEYLPAENAFVPVDADNFYYVNCLWVSGKYKHEGHGKALVNTCIEDAKQHKKDGIVILSSRKKKAFLSDGKFLRSQGFLLADTAFSDYELLYYPLSDKIPKFNDCVSEVVDEQHVLYYSHQCPYTEKYAQLIKSVAMAYGIDLVLRQISDAKSGQSAPCPFTTYSLYLNNHFVTNEILTEKKFIEIIKKI